VMDVNIGIDARFIADYDGPTFQPLFGEFSQSNTTLPFFPAANFYLLARVSSFRVMVVMENFTQYFRDDYNFDVINHPQFDPKLRFGIQWLLKD
jgi:Putative porin